MKLSIKIPELATNIAAKVCPASFTNGFIPFTSSIKQVIPKTIPPTRNPIIFSVRLSSVKSIFFYSDIEITR